jgi:hypothetical protein
VKKLLAWLQRLRAETAPAPPEGEIQVRWLAPHETPFGVEILDCIPSARGMLATTSDPQIARRFGQLLTREDLLARTPADVREVPCDLTYTLREPLVEGPVFRSRKMEEKWDVYFYDGQLYCTRSWTGHVVFRAGLEQAAVQAHVRRIEFSLEKIIPCDSADDEFVLQIFDFVVKSHVAWVMSLHPLPPSSQEESPRTLALFSFSLYGQRGLYGTFADTLTTRTMPFQEFSDSLRTRTT